MSVGARFLAIALFASMAVFQPCAGAGWTIKDAYHLPPAPDHEHATTFHASVSFVNDTSEVNGSATNGTGANGTGTNGTGANGTGTNGTGTNGTVTNQTVNVTSCRLVIESQDNRSGAPLSRQDMIREGASNDFWLTLGPRPPGTEMIYHYEANLSNGTVIRSNSSWFRTQDILAVKWHRSLPEALGLAQELGRPLMVLVHPGYAHTTRWLDENLSRPGIIALSAGFVCCRLDAELSREFCSGRNLTRLPALVFVDATTGNETARQENPFNGPLVEKQMRHILGKGPKPSAETDTGPQYRVEAFALGTVLAAGPAALYVTLRFGKRRKL